MIGTIRLRMLRMKYMKEWKRGRKKQERNSLSWTSEVKRVESYDANWFDKLRSRVSEVCKATGYGLDNRGFGVRVPVGSRIFSSRRLDRFWGPPNLISLTLPYFDNGNIMTCIPIARQRLYKHIPTTNTLNSRTSIARQRSCKHAFLAIEDGIFFLGFVPRSYKRA
jgi:hypothetical protein